MRVIFYLFFVKLLVLFMMVNALTKRGVAAIHCVIGYVVIFLIVDAVILFGGGRVMPGEIIQTLILISLLRFVLAVLFFWLWLKSRDLFHKALVLALVGGPLATI